MADLAAPREDIDVMDDGKFGLLLRKGSDARVISSLVGFVGLLRV